MSKPFARNLRRNQTEAEKLLWGSLRNKRFQDLKFRRQAPMGRFVVDFVCHDRKLVIEIDGGQHIREQENESARTKFFKGEGYKVIRFWNNEVLGNLTGVLEKVAQELELPLT